MDRAFQSFRGDGKAASGENTKASQIADGRLRKAKGHAKDSQRYFREPSEAYQGYENRDKVVILRTFLSDVTLLPGRSSDEGRGAGFDEMSAES